MYSSCCFEAPDDDEYVSPDEWTLSKTDGMEVTTLLDAASSSATSPTRERDERERERERIN